MRLPNIFKDRYLLVVSGLSILILLFSFVFALLEFGEINTPLIIHFDVYKGIDFLGGRMEVFGILFTALAMIVINIFLAESLYNRERFLSFIFAFINLAISILILIAISVIMSVN